MEKESNKKHISKYQEVAQDVWRIRDLFVNMYLVKNETDDSWVLIDAGLKTSGNKILHAAQKLFADIAPSAIILTHAHFDHVGSLQKLALYWDVPVYAHEMEEPYITGRSAYPPPDPFVGGGLMSLLSFLYPKGPIDLAGRYRSLPGDSTVPGLPGWKYHHTPGHAPGHISLFRESDKLLIAGDAFVTTKQESALAALMQPRHLSGPPKYFTYDWEAAANSVKLLASLQPEIVATGHGQPMRGEEMRSSLQRLSDEFIQKAVPASGRYVNDPAVVNIEGVQYVPRAGNKPVWYAGAALVCVAVITFLVIKRNMR